MNGTTANDKYDRKRRMATVIANYELTARDLSYKSIPIEKMTRLELMSVIHDCNNRLIRALNL